MSMKLNTFLLPLCIYGYMYVVILLILLLLLLAGILNEEQAVG